MAKLLVCMICIQKSRSINKQGLEQMRIYGLIIRLDDMLANIMRQGQTIEIVGHNQTGKT